MKKRRRKWSTALGCLVLALSTICTAGCGAKEVPKEQETKTQVSEAPEQTKEVEKTETSEKIVFPLSEPVTMSMFAIINGEVALNDNKAFQKVQEMTNVNWEVQSALPGDINEKRGLLLSSGQYPDVLYKSNITNAEIEKYGQQGIFLELTELINQYAPNLKKVLDEREGAWETITSSNGNIYSLPEIKMEVPSAPVYFFNQKWLERLELKEPTNPDELYQVLKAFKEQDANGNGDSGDEIPITVSDGPTAYMGLMTYFGIPLNIHNNFAEIDGNFVYVPATNEFKEFVSFIEKLYAEGILDKNCFTQSLDQQRAIGASGDILGSFFEYGSFLTVGRDRDEDYKILTPFAPQTFPTGRGIDPGAFVITDACENPELAMAWVDQFYTEEGGRICLMGIENETYKVNDDGTWEWIQGDYKDVSSLRAAAAIQGSALHPGIRPALWDEGMTDPDERLLLSERQRAIAAGGVPLPILKISEEDNKVVASIKAELDVYIKQFVAQVATGEIDLDSSWEEYLSKLDRMGYKELEEIHKTAYEASK